MDDDVIEVLWPSRAALATMAMALVLFAGTGLALQRLDLWWPLLVEGPLLVLLVVQLARNKVVVRRHDIVLPGLRTRTIPWSEVRRVDVGPVPSTSRRRPRTPQETVLLHLADDRVVPLTTIGRIPTSAGLAELERVAALIGATTGRPTERALLRQPPSPDEDRRLRRRVWMPIALFGVASALRIGMLFIAGDGDDVRPPSTEVLALSPPGLGDCFGNGLFATSADEFLEDGEVHALATSCTESTSHAGQVVAQLRAFEADQATYPGRPALVAEALGRCQAQITSVDGVGAPYDVVVLVPYDDAWADGRRELRCAVVRADRELMAPGRLVAHLAT